MTYASIVLLITCLPTQLFLMMKSLSAGKASFALPIFFCCVITLTILLDGVFFRIFECMERSSLVVFCSLDACLPAVSATSGRARFGAGCRAPM